MVEKKTCHAEETEALGRDLGKTLQPGSVVALSGPVGAGKSVLTRGIARGLGIDEPITSPTYTIVSEYDKGRIPFYHMDLYRLESPDEFELIGGEELFYGKGICVIEWYELIEGLLPEHALIIKITIGEEGIRSLQYNREP